MSRLIDADKMLERLEAWNTLDMMDRALYNFAKNRIIEQPTAYDVEKVVEELTDNAIEQGIDYEMDISLDDAIEIIKRGGVE